MKKEINEKCTEKKEITILVEEKNGANCFKMYAD